MLCKAPFLGITIDPAGWIQLCCATNDRRYFGKKITDVDSLKDFFLGGLYDEIRSQMKDGGLGSIGQCSHCWKSLEGGWSEADNYATKSYSEPLTIRYLEVTTSNICNQTCVTCSSYFSSKWRKLEKQFGRGASPSFHLNDESIDKILAVLPDLHYLQIKGGEPFADKNNLKILKELARVNPACKLIITSNFQNIPDEWFDVLKLLKNIQVGASIDGIHETYDWIRGGSFEQTVATMEKFYQITNTKIIVNICVSIYNIFMLKEIRAYFSDKEYVDSVICNNLVSYPEYLSIDLLKKSKIMSAIGSSEEFNNIKNVNGTLRPNPDLVSQFYKHTETMNKVRGSNIFTLQPQLADIFK